MSEITNTDVEQEAIDALIKEHQDKFHIYRYGNRLELIRQVIAHYQDIAEKALVGATQYRDDLIVEFRALGLSLESVLSASTHHEKNARLRGTIELIGASVSRLKQEHFDFQFSSWHRGIDFRRDGITSDLFRQNRELTRRVQELEAAKEGTP